MSREITAERIIAAPLTRVWDVVTSPEHAPDRLASVEQVTMLTTGPYAVGTRWRETRRMMGRRESQELEVVEVDPHQRTVIAAQDGGTAYRSTFELAPQASGTLLTMRFGIDASRTGLGTRLAAAAFGAVGAHMMRQALATELEGIAAAAEQHDTSA